MAPSLIFDMSSDHPSSTTGPNQPALKLRTLLLSPPSLASHPEKLNNVYEAHDRDVTDIQMLDRLSLSLVALPASTYDTMIILSDADNTRSESRQLINRNVLARLVEALKSGGTLRSQDNTYPEPAEHQEAILAGLVPSSEGFRKPDYDTSQALPLRFGKTKVNGGPTSTTTPAGTGVVSLNLNGKRINGPQVTTKPAGVGFVGFGDDSDAPAEAEDDSDDELIDESTLIEPSDYIRPVVQPPECRPKASKRRRACKDCTCGLAQKLAAEDAQKRDEADQNLAKLQLDDLAEVDFTVQGKVGSCGNCALGDAFRCDGCPYIGLPAFKPGEEVRLSLEDEGAL